MARTVLTDEQWTRLVRHLPSEKPRTGRPSKPHRPVVEGMFWIARTGAPWRDLTKEFGPWKTVATRFYRWCAAGVFDRAPAALQAEADAAGRSTGWRIGTATGWSGRSAATRYEKRATHYQAMTTLAAITLWH
jgi:transposase